MSNQDEKIKELQERINQLTEENKDLKKQKKSSFIIAFNDKLDAYHYAPAEDFKKGFGKGWVKHKTVTTEEEAAAYVQERKMYIVGFKKTDKPVKGFSNIYDIATLSKGLKKGFEDIEGGPFASFLEASQAANLHRAKNR